MIQKNGRGTTGGNGEGSRAAGSSPFRVALYHPEIPQNTGNIARTCAATHTPLHLVEPLGFQLTDRYLKRAGLDYWPYVEMSVHPTMEHLRESRPDTRWIYLSTHADRLYYDFDYQPGDGLVFGPETAGLPPEMIDGAEDRALRIPIDRTRVRSLNLATAVAIVIYEAMRHLDPQEAGGNGWFHVSNGF